MRISVLTDMISEEIPCVVSGYIEDVELKRFMFLTETASTYDDVCLYIGDAERLKGASYRMTLLTMAETDEETEKNHTVIRVPQEYYAECLNVVTKAFFHEQELEDAFNRLLSRPVEHTSFHEIINNAAVFMDRSLVLTDLSFHVVDYSTSRMITDPIWKNNVKRGSCSYEFIEAMNVLVPDYALPNTPEPFFVNCDASKENKLCSTIFFNHQPIGYLVLLDNEKGIEPYHLQYLPRISQILIFSLKHSPNFRSLFLNASENVFLNLLEGKVADQAYLQMLNVTMRIPKAMRCLVFIPKNRSKHDLFYMLRNLYSLFPLGSIFLYQDQVIAVLSDEDTRKLCAPDFCEEQIKNVKEVGISSVFRALPDFPEYLEYAKMACEMATKLGENGVIHQYDKYQFFHILSSCRDEKLLRAYVHPAFDVLREYDLANDTALLKTLQAYVENGMNTKETASALYLHRNTLTYRLNKIRELTDLDFEDLDTVFRLSCSFRINRLLQI